MTLSPLTSADELSYKAESKQLSAMVAKLDFRLQQQAIHEQAVQYAKAIKRATPSLMEAFMRKYHLSSSEGTALVCLAESLLRIPDDETAIELIENKLLGKDWHGTSNNKSGLWLIDATSWGLSATNALLKISNKTIGQLTKPAILKVIRQVMKVISGEFIMGSEIPDAVNSAHKYIKSGYRLSFDILGESSRTAEQADYYFEKYITAIEDLGNSYKKGGSLYERPNISVKLSALHPRVELIQHQRVISELLPKLRKLVQLAIKHHLTLSFDAEESTRGDIYLDVVFNLIEETPEFNGIGLVVQAYQRRAPQIISTIIDLAKRIKNRIPVRLVKGAYWDSEIKFAQENGLKDYPVYTKKHHTDISYIYCASKLLQNPKHIYPQFATHNAITMAYIKTMAGDKEFEFQKLHGMGNALHKASIKETPTRIYAPVGQYQDLLAYLMRRMLENGANTSFVYRATDPNISIQELIADPIKLAYSDKSPLMARPDATYRDRTNSRGYDVGQKYYLTTISQHISKHLPYDYTAASIIDGIDIKSSNIIPSYNPAKHIQKIGEVHQLSSNIKQALEVAHGGFNSWSSTPVTKRADILDAIADKFHQHRYELYALLITEAGKNIKDSIAEVREAIDFARYYATKARKLFKPIKLPGYTGETNELTHHGRGVFLCISPWNFPLARFAGQILGALVTGNTVIAKPASNTTLIAHYATKLMLEAGLPKSALQLTIASGSYINKELITDSRINGVCFTGSNEAARKINRTLAARDCSIAPLIAETGGQNAMIIDSSALLEQATDSIILSAFGSAGQRCSALRVLYVQEDIEQKLLELIDGALQQLQVGNPVDFSNDIGPVINNEQRNFLANHISHMIAKGCELYCSHHSHELLKHGSFFAPHVIKIKHISDIDQEVFGPVLHVISYKNSELDQIVDEINSTGYGLTFGIHSRIDSRISRIQNTVKAGNIYVNRSIIGAQVGTQPFGGEGLSGTGFKAGGPNYLLRFCSERVITNNTTAIGGNIELINR
jgi:RHH-type proline utilization regulon transcriptional repressor/proline dehydrogenase/delta 1-pyrroline-5-carboxylate dehydrogenase